MRVVAWVLVIVGVTSVPLAAAEDWPPAIAPLFRTVELNVGESCKVTLSDGSEATVKLLDLKQIRDDLRQAVRTARLTVEVNGQQATLTSAYYRLPAAVGGVQIDSPLTKGFGGFKKDARLRLWPAGSPWIQPGTFVYPVKQRWFASHTQMAYEPTFVDSFEDPDTKEIYYHYGLDFGGAEGLVDVVAATDGVVVSAGLKTVIPPDYPPTVQPSQDMVYIRDGRGWYYCYAHLFSIDPAMKPGARVKMGQTIGLLGKEGGSGGWSHLHLDISAPQPNGRYGYLDGYAFIWQAYHAQHETQLQAVARPHHLLWAGDSITLDATRSWSAKGPQHIASYRWTLSDGTEADGPTLTRRYERSGEYSEILKVTDTDGRIDYDFAVVQVVDRENPKPLPPSIHAVYWPTFDLKVGDEVTFMVRSFGIKPTEGRERWDFDDGSPVAEVQSDGNVKADAGDGYVTTKHRYAKPGHYLVAVSRTNDRGQTATARLHVRID